MEEWIWYMAPVAVAVLAYLLDIRASRRHETDMDTMRERFHRVEMAYVQQFAAIEKWEALQDKLLERHDERLGALEGVDPAVTKEDGAKYESAIKELHNNVLGLVFNQNKLETKIDNMTAPGDEEDE